jgi:cysteine desulfurase
VPAIVGFGAACEMATARLAEEARRLDTLRERLQQLIVDAMPSAVVHGHATERLPGLLSVGFPGIDGDVLLHALQGVAVSQGSACSSGSFGPSHVLRAMGVADALARSTLRFGIGRFNTQEEMERAAGMVAQAVARLSW